MEEAMMLTWRGAWVLEQASRRAESPQHKEESPPATEVGVIL